MTLSRQDIFERLRNYLEEMFEIEPARVTPDVKLYEDLDLDSIDAVDLIVKLQDLTGRKVRPEVFKTVRTVGDVVTCVEDMLAEVDDAPNPLAN